MMNIENVETIKAIENNTEKINNIEIMKKRAEIPRSNNEKPMQIGLDIRDKTAEEELSQDDKELKEMQNRLDILYLENKQLRRSFQKRPDMEKFWDDKKLKIGAINRNLRLSSAMIDPCSHRYYLSKNT